MPTWWNAQTVIRKNYHTDFVNIAGSSMDPRHVRRIKIIQNLFAYSFENLQGNLPFPDEPKSKKIIADLDPIDKYIKTHAPRYPLKNISKIDLAILRASVYELMLEKKTPQKVIINEAVELAKELSGENSYAFINAVLGKIMNEKS